MKSLLVDTNVISFMLKGDSRAEMYKKHLNGSLLSVPFMSVAELYQWAAMRNWGPSRKQNLEAMLQTFSVVPFDAKLCRFWGRIRAKSYSVGRPISPQDAWIAATALQHNLPLVTHNPKDFSIFGEIETISALRY